MHKGNKTFKYHMLGLCLVRRAEALLPLWLPLPVSVIPSR